MSGLVERLDSFYPQPHTSSQSANTLQCFPNSLLPRMPDRKREGKPRTTISTVNLRSAALLVSTEFTQLIRRVPRVYFILWSNPGQTQSPEHGRPYTRWVYTRRSAIRFTEKATAVQCPEPRNLRVCGPWDAPNALSSHARVGPTLPKSEGNYHDNEKWHYASRDDP